MAGRPACVGPTTRQKQLYAFIVEHVHEHGYQPSQSEMGAHLGVSKAAIRDLLKGLAQRGWIGDPDGRERAIPLNGLQFPPEQVETEVSVG